MPKFVADFHIHSRYSRACSKELSIAELTKWAKIKGIGVLGTGDFTHPLWLQELKDTLQATGTGLFEQQGARFLLTGEVNTLFYRREKAHQVHHLVFAPSLEAVDRINTELQSFGNLEQDGRPMLKLEAWRLVQIVRAADPRCFVVPAHVWTPWFGVFGSSTGFDLLEECFQDESQHIFALETGLSSDPSMNWRLTALDRYALISNSDSHSAPRIGREANLFDCELSYDAIADALRTKDRTRFLGTLEFFPEEGKYHYDGHRACRVRWSPAQTRQHGFRCPTCGRKVTIGVMHRVEALADRPEGTVPDGAVPFRRIVGLDKIIADALGVGVQTQAVEREYMQLIHACGSEFEVLLNTPEQALRQATQPRIADGILWMRQGKVTVEPGYDGEYGVIRIFQEAPTAVGVEQQMTLF